MMKGHMCGLHKVAYLLLIVGGLNWGLVGALNFDLVEWILGSIPVLQTIVYVLVGLSAIAMMFTHSCKACKAQK
jgi:uncharacterized membrane protein YuzA (DUF378 family)